MQVEEGPDIVSLESEEQALCDEVVLMQRPAGARGEVDMMFRIWPGARQAKDGPPLCRASVVRLGTLILTGSQLGDRFDNISANMTEQVHLATHRYWYNCWL